MRTEKALITLLERFVRIVSDEADRNPEFGSKLDELLSALPQVSASRRTRVKKLPLESLPDIYSEFAARGEADFELWLRQEPVPVLHALVREHDLDAARRTHKWKEAEKLSAFITEQIAARIARGSGFLSSKTQEGGD